MASVKVVGGSGFLGRHVAAALLQAGHDVTAPAHEDLDIARQSAEEIALQLTGAEIVVNCAGLARDARVDNLNAVNKEGPKALAHACQLAGVRRFIHVSALGATDADASRFQRSKGEAEAAVSATEGVEVVILRPSLAVGPGGASGDFFSALAALPLAPRLADGSWRVQPLHVNEISELVVKLATMSNPPQVLDAVGPTPMTTDELTRSLRDWLGLPETRSLALPRPVLRFFAWANEIVEFGPGDREFLNLLERGNTGDPSGAAAVLGREPLSLERSLARQPASLGDFWRARLYFIQPLLRLSLAILWLGTGVVSFGLFPPSEFYVMLGELGLVGASAEVALFGVAMLNLILGALLLVNWRPALTATLMLALLFVFSGAALMLPREYWLTPFAPVLKNAPIAVALMTLIGMQRPSRPRKTPAEKALLAGASARYRPTLDKTSRKGSAVQA